MATPVVTISFTADVQCGVSPLTVQFTDTSIVDVGFKRMWLWTFGDGSISEDQNPTHIYTGDPGQSYTVELMVLATTGEFDALSFGTLAAVRISNERLQGVDFTEQDAWDGRVDAPLSSAKAKHILGFNGSQYFYTTERPILSMKSTVSTPTFTLIMTEWSVFDADISTLVGEVDILGILGATGLSGILTTHSRLPVEYTASNPLITTATITPENQLPAPTSGSKSGMAVFIHTRTYADTSTQGFGEDEEVGFVAIATAPVAAFSASPSAGNNPLSVLFTNETVESNCGPASTYSWKKRILGSGASFVEFSTDENPTEIFTK